MVTKMISVSFNPHQKENFHYIMMFAMEAHVSYDRYLPVHYLSENGDLTKTTCMKFETIFSSVVSAQTYFCFC